MNEFDVRAQPWSTYSAVSRPYRLREREDQDEKDRNRVLNVSKVLKVPPKVDVTAFHLPCEPL